MPRWSKSFKKLATSQINLLNFNSLFKDYQQVSYNSYIYFACFAFCIDFAFIFDLSNTAKGSFGGIN